MNPLKRVISTLCILAIGVITGCVFDNSDNVIEPLEEDPFIVGEITQTKEGKVYNTILVEENTEVHEPSEPGGKKIRFGLGNWTEILIQHSDGSLSKSSLVMLKVGQKVKGWPSGAIADSYPQQGSAKRIVIIIKEAP